MDHDTNDEQASSRSEEDLAHDSHLLSSVRGLGDVHEPDADAKKRAAVIDPADWHGMRGPDDERHPEVVS